MLSSLLKRLCAMFVNIFQECNKLYRQDIVSDISDCMFGFYAALENCVHGYIRFNSCIEL